MCVWATPCADNKQFSTFLHQVRWSLNKNQTGVMLSHRRRAHCWRVLVTPRKAYSWKLRICKASTSFAEDSLLGKNDKIANYVHPWLWVNCIYHGWFLSTSIGGFKKPHSNWPEVLQGNKHVYIISISISIKNMLGWQGINKFMAIQTLVGTVWGFSSGSAGGAVTPADVPIPSVEPPVMTNPPSPKASPALSSPEPVAVKPEVSVDALQADALEKLKCHMRNLEDQMMAELEQKKRQAEQDLETHMAVKRKRLQEQVDVLAEERSEQECRLALVSEQLQEKMQCLSEEQTTLDELKEKSRMMQEQLSSMPVTPRTEDGQHRKTQHKEALKLKLQAAALKTPENSTQSPASVHSQQSQQPPPSKQSTPTGGPSDGSSPPPDALVLVPTSSQRFTSSTHPEAWQYLYRLTKSKDKCDEEIYKAWHEGLGCVLFFYTLQL